MNNDIVFRMKMRICRVCRNQYSEIQKEHYAKGKKCEGKIEDSMMIDAAGLVKRLKEWMPMVPKLPGQMMTCQGCKKQFRIAGYLDNRLLCKSCAIDEVVGNAD